MKRLNYLIILIAFTSVIGCGKKKTSITTDSALADSVEAGITAMAGASDDQSGASVSLLHKKKLDFLYELINPIPNAYAATCSGRAASQSCSSGTKSITYSSCTLGSSSQTLFGTVTLTYSQSACTFSATNDTITRTFDYSRTTSFGATVRTFSSAHTNYAGNSYSGGSKLTKTASGYELQIMGKHKTRTNSGGRSKLDISMRTTSNITMDNLNRTNRTITGGALEVYHNLGQVTVKMVPSSLTYISTCCYPISGSIALTYSGTISATGSVTFTSCGSATVTKGADTYNINLYSCE